jgi:hypothetical protein
VAVARQEGRSFYISRGDQLFDDIKTELEQWNIHYENPQQYEPHSRRNYKTGCIPPPGDEYYQK